MKVAEGFHTYHLSTTCAPCPSKTGTKRRRVVSSGADESLLAEDAEEEDDEEAILLIEKVHML